MKKTVANTFGGGKNGDLDKSISPNDTFLEAYNLHLVGDGKFMALENLQGISDLLTLDASVTNCHIPGIFPVRAKIDGTSEECLLIWKQENFTTLSIILYRASANAYETIFTETISGTALVDAVAYPENGVDTVYYTDGINELRKLRLEFTSPITAFSAQQISLQRRAPLANVSVSFATGGTLLTGSYQFSIRFYNSGTKSYSKWSLLTTPQYVTYTSVNPGTYGLISNKKLTINATGIPTSEQNLWTHFQVAVLENTSETVPVTASLQPLTTFTGSSAAYDYKSNDAIGTISLTDIVVDLAAIEYCSTLAVKNNRVFVGNLQYKNLTYDRTPTVTGSVATYNHSQTPTDSESSTYKGHFRDEVYRYYAVYWDDKYNFYRPYKLDMSSITGNQLVSAGSDMRFPARNGNYTLLNNSDQFVQIGLSLTIDHHPSNARGVAVFRAKRKKKKLFQTPVIPAVEIQGLGAVGEYPNIALENPVTSGNATSKEYPTATPMNPLGTLMPKNMFYVNAQHMVQRTMSDTSYGRYPKGEPQIVTSEWYTGPANNYFYIYPPDLLNGLSTSEPSASHKLTFVDFALTRLDYTKNSTDTSGSWGTSNPFNYLETSIHGTFYANRNTDYYHTYGNTLAYPLGIQGTSVVNYTPLTNYGEGTTLGGNYIGKYTNLDTGGITFGASPNNLTSGVVQVSTGLTDFSYFANSIKPGAIPTPLIKSHKGPAQPINDASNTADNTSFISSGSFTENSTYCQAIAIADVENDLDDLRYGPDATIHDLEFTGFAYTFSDAEVTNVVATGNSPVAATVFGGDCWVGLHNFKITDGHYALTNASKGLQAGAEETSDQLVQQWSHVFNGGSPARAAMPVPLKNVSQVLAVVLESEVNGYFTPPQPYTSAVPVSPAGTIRTSSTESQYRIAFSTSYNKGYTATANQKVLVPYNSTETITSYYPARALYSDQKVYNTDIQGFDSFPILNYVDLDETYRGITKLALAGDNLFAIQERGVAMIPVDAQLLSTTDAATISVRSGTTDLPVYLSRVNGSQHIKSVQVLPDKVIFADNRTAQVFSLSDSLEPISEKGAIARMKQRIGPALPAASIFSLYDPKKRQYWIYSPGAWCVVWDDRLGIWQDELELSSGLDRFYGGALVNNYLYVVGRESNALKVGTMYTGNPNEFYGAAATPRVKVAVNADYPYNKTFDSLIVYSSDPIATADITAEKDSASTGFSVSGMNFDVDRREGYYIIPVLRDVNGARIRATRADVTLKWPTDTTVSVSQLVTNYRQSSRWPDK